MYWHAAPKQGKGYAPIPFGGRVNSKRSRRRRGRGIGDLFKKGLAWAKTGISALARNKTVRDTVKKAAHSAIEMGHAKAKKFVADKVKNETVKNLANEALKKGRETAHTTVNTVAKKSATANLTKKMMPTAAAEAPSQPTAEGIGRRSTFKKFQRGRYHYHYYSHRRRGKGFTGLLNSRNPRVALSSVGTNVV